MHRESRVAVILARARVCVCVCVCVCVHVHWGLGPILLLLSAIQGHQGQEGRGLFVVEWCILFNN